MDKTRKILLLINLLESRKQLDLKTIKSFCGIPERSAYRYINTISEANIPVYFDSDVKAYKLREELNHAISNIDTQDMAIILLALKSLIPIVNDSYAADMDDLFKRLCAMIGTKFELLNSSEDTLRSDKSKDQNSLCIIESIAYLGAFCGRRLRIIYLTEAREKLTITFGKPNFFFNKEWIVGGIGQSGEIEIPISAIEHIRLL